MYGKNGGKRSAGKSFEYIPPPPVVLETKQDEEVYLDLLTAALTGTCGTLWQEPGGWLKPNGSKMAGTSAAEAADVAFAAYKERVAAKVKRMEKLVEPAKPGDTDTCPW